MTESQSRSPCTTAAASQRIASVMEVPGRCALPWIVFGLGLVGTTGISATLVAVSDGAEWGFRPGRADELFLNVDALDFPWRRLAYWMVWGIPFVVSLAIAAILLAAGSRKEAPSLALSREERRTVFVAVSAFLLVWAWLTIRLGGLDPATWQSVVESWSSPLEDHYAFRYAAREHLLLPESAMLISGLPALYSLAAAAVLRSSVRVPGLLGLFGLFALYSVVALMTHQKLLIAMFLALNAVIAIALKGVRGILVALVLGVVAFVLILVTMSIAMPEWDPAMTVDHLIGRTGDAYPFAIEHGLRASERSIDVLYWTVGVAGGDVSVQLNRVIGDAMYPGSGTTVALAAPVWAFASDGFPGWLMSCVMVAIIQSVASFALVGARQSIVAAAIGCSLAVSTYWLTQLPIAGVLVWSHSVVVGVAACIAARAIARLAGRSYKQQGHRSAGESGSRA